MNQGARPRAVLGRRAGGSSVFGLMHLDAHLARLAFDRARSPTPSDPDPLMAGLSGFLDEAASRAFALVTLGGSVGIDRAVKEGRINAQSGSLEVFQAYLEGVFNGITFGGAEAFVNARAGEGKGLGASLAAGFQQLGSSAIALEELAILSDPKKSSWEKAEAGASLVAKWAGLAAGGVAGGRAARARFEAWRSGRAAPAPPVAPVETPKTAGEAEAAARTQGAEAGATIDPKSTAPPRFLESKGADVTRPDKVVGSASTPGAVKTSIRPSIAEAEAYKEALRRGEIGLQRPAHANAPGTDFLTVVRDRITRQYRIVVTDVKSSTIGAFPPARTSLSPSWLREVQEAVAPGRLDLGNPVLEAQIRAAVAHGRISIRRITVDYSAAGQGAMRGF